MGRKKDVKYVNSDLKKKGIKHGVHEVERSHYVDEDGNIREEEMHYREDRRHFKSNCLQCFSSCLVWLRCLPKDPDDMLSIKNWLLWVQWMTLVCDLVAAIVAFVTFQDVTYCCGTPILQIAGQLHWKLLIRVLTYVYLAMVFLEIYPVVRQGFPFNIVNPLVGFVITFAMFFDDSMVEALTLWVIETTAIICEYALYRLKVRQNTQNAKELKEVGRKTKRLRKAGEDEDPDAPQQELTELRQRYYQLKEDQSTDKTMLWYLATGCYVNIVLSLIVLTLILTISQGGGLCVDNFKIPNPFNLDQLGSCPLCENVTNGVCEICTNETSQCYYPYS